MCIFKGDNFGNCVYAYIPYFKGDNFGNCVYTYILYFTLNIWMP